MNMTPNLYKLALAGRNNLSVRDDQLDNKWKTRLMRKTIADQMSEFGNLWGLLQQGQLIHQPDVITWKWTSHSTYTTKSAYLHKLFGWLSLQFKIFTADKISIRNWPCTIICSLCDQEKRTAVHLCLECSCSRVQMSMGQGEGLDVKCNCSAWS
uniref:Reverse transcriptase zinc-binding domain-containing protein n=1 Tax=Arundo donax TaxID=35708 RepID=A0A0A9CTE5_ARUDO